MIAFGPVPSRRLGRSVGINNIPPKFCSFACVYCQVGSTTKKQIERRRFYDPENILKDVQAKLEKTMEHGEAVDYLTFVPDGEPTLDIHLGQEIDALKDFGVKIAVISNASLIWQEEVCADLKKADWVSLKVDTVHEAVWRKINRPHHRLSLDSILNGMLEFSKIFSGQLVVETMLVEGVNDSDELLGLLSDFLYQLNPGKVYCSVPIRPPAETWVRLPSEETINRAYQILGRRVKQIEYLIGYEGSDFGYTGDVVEDLLGITAVHPMRKEAVVDFLRKAGSDWSAVRRLLHQGQLIEADYEGKKFYLRKPKTS